MNTNLRNQPPYPVFENGCSKSFFSLGQIPSTICCTAIVLYSVDLKRKYQVCWYLSMSHCLNISFLELTILSKPSLKTCIMWPSTNYPLWTIAFFRFVFKKHDQNINPSRTRHVYIFLLSAFLQNQYRIPSAIIAGQL